MSMVIVCSVVTFGQTAGTKPEQSAAKPDNPITVVGCVAPGTAAGQFQLTNATMASAMAQERKSDTAKANTGETYMLTGGENLKAHVGHKVEVTGTLARAIGQDRAAQKSEKPSTEAMPSAAMVRGTLAVTNVKMVSTTCP
jgi:hypothetical protein